MSDSSQRLKGPSPYLNFLLGDKRASRVHLFLSPPGAQTYQHGDLGWHTIHFAILVCLGFFLQKLYFSIYLLFSKFLSFLLIFLSNDVTYNMLITILTRRLPDTELNYSLSSFDNIRIQWGSQNAEKVTHIKGRLLDQAVIIFNCVPFHNRHFSYSKEFAPRGSKFFPLRAVP